MSSSTRDVLVTIVGAVVAVVLEVILAPYISIVNAQPNILLAYALAIAMVRADSTSALLPFFLGLLYDLLGTGPVGGMALVMVVVCSITAYAFRLLEKRSFLVALAAFLISSLLAETLYGILLIMLGLSVGVVEAFVYRALPCAVYDCVAGLLIYLVVARLFKEKEERSDAAMPIIH